VRIGIFGGTFDPIHRAHVAIGQAAQKHKALDKVLFVVAAAPPHKGASDISAAEDRFAMVEAALAGEPFLEASGIELERSGPSYTVDTIKALRTRHPEAEFQLIVGEDSLLDLPNWYKTEDILTEVRVLVLPRPGTAATVPDGLEGHYEFLPFEPSMVSSTDVRRRLAAGEGVEDALTPAVIQIAKERGLYNARC
jgi:nicotinate-nucleotide adenylyltransferase